MGLFSKKDSTERTPRSKRGATHVGSDDVLMTPAEALRQRARRRLIGACAMLFTAVVLIPMFLDADPNLVPHSIPVDIPSQTTAFIPQPTPSPDDSHVPIDTSVASNTSATSDIAPVSPESTRPASTPAAPSPVGQASTPSRNPTPLPTTTPTTPAVPSTNDQELAKLRAAAEERARVERLAAEQRIEANRQADAERARAILEGRSVSPTVSPAATTKYVVQAGAFSTLERATEVKDKLKQNGISATINSSDTDRGKVFRVRVGGFSTKEEADSMLAKMKAVGYPDSKLVAL